MGFLESLAEGLLDGDNDTNDKKSGGLQLTPSQIALFVQTAAGIVMKIGLPKIIELFTKAGLGDEVMSWIGKGTNKSVSGKDVESALGTKIIGELARKTGIDASAASAALAKYLPKVLDGLTPDGKADDNAAKSLIGGFNLGDMAKIAGSLLK